MASSDYFMRQIEGMTDMLSVALFGQKADDNPDFVYHTQTSADAHFLLVDLRFLITSGMINEAENLLFEHIESDSDSCYLEIARQFYFWLDSLSDADLANSGFTRGEIAEGRNAVSKYYNG